MQHPCVATVHFLLTRCEGRFDTAVNHECEGIRDAEEALPVMGERASEKKNSWFEKRTTTFLLQILQMTSKLLENT